jgi:hypothetical protein
MEWENECPVCLEDIAQNNFYITDCHHAFHRKCMVSVCAYTLRKKYRCPVCRQSINVTDMLETENQAIIENYENTKKEISKQKSQLLKLNFQYTLSFFKRNHKDYLIEKEYVIMQRIDELTCRKLELYTLYKNIARQRNCTRC